MRKFLFGLFGAMALCAGAVTAQPASAQPFDLGYRQDRPLLQTVQYYRPYYRRPYYRGYGYYGRPYGYYRPYVGPRCVVRTRRFWNGFRWVWRSVRICR